MHPCVRVSAFGDVWNLSCSHLAWCQCNRIWISVPQPCSFSSPALPSSFCKMQNLGLRKQRRDKERETRTWIRPKYYWWTSTSPFTSWISQWCKKHLPYTEGIYYDMASLNISMTHGHTCVLINHCGHIVVANLDLCCLCVYSVCVRFVWLLTITSLAHLWVCVLIIAGTGVIRGHQRWAWGWN